MTQLAWQKHAVILRLQDALHIVWMKVICCMLQRGQGRTAFSVASPIFDGFVASGTCYS